MFNILGLFLCVAGRIMLLFSSLGYGILSVFFVKLKEAQIFEISYNIVGFVIGNCCQSL